MNTRIEKANTLSQALPYIQRYNGKIIVVKYGGNAMIDEELKRAVISDIVLLSLVGIKVVLVHGGGPEISDMLKKIGKASKFIDGLRYTDEETADIVQMVLAGKVNKDIVSLIEGTDGRAIGLCGLDGGMIKARKIEGPQDLGYVGEVQAVDVRPILDVMDKGYIPVIATVGKGTDGHVYNINADTAAAQIATALRAEKLILLTDVKGLMRDLNDESTLIPVIKVSSVPLLMKEGIIKGGMIPKVDCCVECVRRGVKRAHIIDGTIPHSILMELLSDEGIGTLIE